ETPAVAPASSTAKQDTRGGATMSQHDEIDRRPTEDPQEPDRYLVTRRRLVGGAAAAAAALATGGTRFARSAAAAPGSRAGDRVATADDGPAIIIGTLGEAATINP